LNDRYSSSALPRRHW